METKIHREGHEIHKQVRNSHDLVTKNTLIDHPTLLTVLCYILKGTLRLFPAFFMRGLSHGEGAAYLSPEVPCCREQLRQSQTICIIFSCLGPCSRILNPFSFLEVSNYPPVFLTHCNSTLSNSLVALLSQLLGVSEKRSGQSKTALPDPPIHRDSVEALAAISVTACSFLKREHVCAYKRPSSRVPL